MISHYFVIHPMYNITLFYSSNVYYHTLLLSAQCITPATPVLPNTYNFLWLYCDAQRCENVGETQLVFPRCEHNTKQRPFSIWHSEQKGKNMHLTQFSAFSNAQSKKYKDIEDGNILSVSVYCLYWVSTCILLCHCFVQQLTTDDGPNGCFLCFLELLSVSSGLHQSLSLWNI